jgi:hypothetical protein
MSVRIAIMAMGLALVGACAIGPTADSPAVAEPQPSRMTIIEKNQMWPVKGLITSRPCAVRACQEV